jgi:hypothetical protein
MDALRILEADKLFRKSSFLVRVVIYTNIRNNVGYDISQAEILLNLAQENQMNEATSVDLNETTHVSNVTSYHS